jgi:hypothetical protein
MFVMVRVLGTASCLLGIAFLVFEVASYLQIRRSTAWATPSVYFCFGYFGDEGLKNCLPRLASNSDPPNVSFPSS